MTSEADRGTALRFLTGHHVATLAVSDADGPWAAAVFYAADDDFHLTFVSSPRSRHAVALAADPRAAVTIQGQPTDWTAIQGLQLEGKVRRLAGVTRARAMARYVARFATIAADPRLALALRRVAVYEFVPSRAYLVDNRSFGRRREVAVTER